MDALVRMPPKPHEGMKVGKARAKKSRSLSVGAFPPSYETLSKLLFAGDLVSRPIRQALALNALKSKGRPFPNADSKSSR
jgi:hypothetical protein